MKRFFLVLTALIVAAGCGKIQTEAQIRASGNGTVVNANPKTKKNTVEISSVDFKNFTFPEFAAEKADQSFTLKNGESEKKAGTPKYSLRKTYYFDLTDDDQDEAVSQIIAEGCQISCDPRSLFFVYTIENNQPKLLWKIATGVDELGGLKSVNFKSREIVLESFGECHIEDSRTKPKIDVKNNPKMTNSNYTRFVFTLGADGFNQTTREILPHKITNFIEYRPRISFGNQP